jgi:methylenetetrahydrofolate reductase (NADPH)
MHVTEILKHRQKTLVSLEITPPEKGHSIGEIFEAVDQLAVYHPSFINVTYHQQHIVYEEIQGKIIKVPRRKKPGTIGICAALVNRYKMETVPHLICGGFNKYETEDALIDLHYLGFDNLFALRGDPPNGIKEFIPELEGHRHATELVEQVASLNQGKYLENLEGALPTNFCIGVAGYPEKHYESPNLNEDIKYLKEKVDKGAKYIITQMLFSAETYHKYVEAVRAAGITVPIIPGIKIITSAHQLTALPRDFHLDLPDELVSAVRNADGPTTAREAGLAYTVKFCSELIGLGAPCLHFYTMGKGTLVAEALNRLKQKNLI